MAVGIASRLCAYGPSKGGADHCAEAQCFGTPEFRELGQSVFEMGVTLQSRAASGRAFTDHVTHELKSPLTSIQGAAELLHSADLKEEDRVALCETVSTASHRMNALLNDLRHHAISSQSGGVGACLLTEAITQDLETQISASGDELVPLAVAGLTAIIVQFGQNTAAHGADQLDLVWGFDKLTILNNGDGIAVGYLERIFDPFFPSRRDQGGTRMGLAVVRSLLNAHGSRIDPVKSAKGAPL